MVCVVLESHNAEETIVTLLSIEVHNSMGISIERLIGECGKNEAESYYKKYKSVSKSLVAIGNCGHIFTTTFF